MSAEAVSFEVLRKTLEIDGFLEFDRRGFDRPFENFWGMLDQLPINRKCSCCSVDALGNTGSRRYGCASVTGRNCAIERINDVIIEDIFRLIHFYKIHKGLIESGNDLPLSAECIRILRKYIRIEKAPKLKGLTFYTIVPEKRLPFNDGQINKLKKLCEKMFTKKNFSKCAWVIEAGKHKDCPNLHIHCIGKLLNKNFKRSFISKWNKIYDEEYNIEYDDDNNRGWDMKPCNTSQIQIDKMNYLDNRLKGSHENFVDLKCGSKWGDW